MLLKDITNRLFNQYKSDANKYVKLEDMKEITGLDNSDKKTYVDIYNLTYKNDVINTFMINNIAYTYKDTKENRVTFWRNPANHDKHCMRVEMFYGKVCSWVVCLNVRIWKSEIPGPYIEGTLGTYIQELVVDIECD
jgi:hypothetical protein